MHLQRRCIFRLIYLNCIYSGRSFRSNYWLIILVYDFGKFAFFGDFSYFFSNLIEDIALSYLIFYDKWNCFWQCCLYFVIFMHKLFWRSDFAKLDESKISFMSFMHSKEDEMQEILCLMHNIWNCIHISNYYTAFWIFSEYN